MQKSNIKNIRCLIVFLAIALGIGSVSLFGLQYYAREKATSLNALIDETSAIRAKSSRLLSVLSIGGQDRQNVARNAVAKIIPELKNLVAKNEFERSRMETVAGDCDRYLTLISANESGKANNIAQLKAEIHSLLNAINDEEGRMLLDNNRKANQTFLLSIETLFVDTFVTVFVIVALFIVLILEINKKRKIQNELFVSREWMSQTLYCMGDAVITTNEKGDVTYLNKVAEELTGISIQEAVGKRVEDVCEILSEENNSKVENPVRRALNENTVVFMPGNTLLVKHSDTGQKTIYNIDDSAAPIRDADNCVIGAVMIFRDITEQATTRRKLEKSEKLLKNIIDNTTALVYIKDLDGNYLMLNRQHALAFNLEPEKAIGTNVLQKFPDEIASKMRETDWKAINEKRLVESEQTIQHADGTLHDYQTSKFPLYNCSGEVYAVCGVSTDITESRRNIEMQEKLATQDALLQNELKYTDLFLNAPFYVGVLKGKDHIYELANRPYLELAGYDTMVGKSVAEIFPEAKEQGFIELLDNVYQTGESFYGNEVLVNLNRDGGIRPVYIDLLYQPFKNSNGQVEGIFIFGVDVTEKVQTRKKVEKTGKRFEALIENSQEMLWLVNAEGKLKYASPAAEKMIGISARGASSPGWIEALCPLDFEKATDQFNSAIVNFGTPVHSTIQSKRQDGSFVWIEGTLTNMLHLPEVNAIVANFRDVSKRKRAEEKIIQTERFLSESQALAKVGNWNFYPANKEVFWSKGLREIYGVTEDFPASFEAFVSMLHPEDKHRVVYTIFSGRQKGHDIHDEYRIIRPDGKERVIKAEIRNVIDSDGTLLRSYGASLDVTELKETRFSLQRSETNLRTIYDNSNIAYVLLDNDLNIVSCNKLAQRFARENINTKISEGAYVIDYFPQEVKWQLKRQIIMVISCNKRISYHKNFNDAGGNERWFSIKLIPVSDNDKRVFGVVIAIADITDRKLSELEKEKITNDLIRKNKDLNMFAYMISHNLRAPISKIIGLSDLVDSNIENLEMNRELIGHLVTEVSNLDGVVKEMNTVISVRDSDNVKTDQVVFLDKLRAIEHVLEYQIRETNATITSDFNEVESVESVKSYIYSITYNLLSNAIKYRAEERPLKIHLSTNNVDQFVCFSIRDNGSGIDMAKNGDKLFGLYKRFHTGNIPGRGIGLSLVKAQVESLGGKIEVESKLNEGTAFKVFIPKNS